MDIKVALPADVKLPSGGDQVRVLLPAGYSDRCEYPVLYLLHGVGDRFSSWTQATDVAARTATLPWIIVMPDAGRSPEAGWYTDWKDGSRQWETFHTEVLPHFVARQFSVAEDQVGIAGYSMGGYGAVSYAARHQGTYRVAASFSGALDTTLLTPTAFDRTSQSQHRLGAPGPGVWGDPVTNRAAWEDHNPTARAANLAGTRVLVRSGTGVPLVGGKDDPTNVGSSAMEQYVFQHNLQFVRALTAAGVGFESDFYPGGQHSWAYVQLGLDWALPKLQEALGEPACR